MVSKQRDPLKKYRTANNVVLQLLTKNKQHTKNQWHISLPLQWDTNNTNPV